MNAVFFPSEILHLHSLPPSSSPSNNTDGGKKSSSNPINRKNVVICYKDRISFYKSTRKVRRTATRIWSWSVEAAVSDKEVVCEVRNVHYIGKRSSSPSPSLTRLAVVNEDDEKTAICKRLAIEFSSNSRNTTILTLQTIDEDEYNLHVTNFHSDENLDYGSNINVIFIDLDVIIHNDNYKCGINHFNLIQSILTSSLIQNNNNEDLTGGGSIVHIRSEVLCRITTTMNTTVGAKNGVSGDDILQHCLSLKNDTSTNNNKVEHTSTIRRLRDEKSASNCPLVMYPPRYIELSRPPSSTNDNEDDEGNDDNRYIFGELLEICRFHNYDTERGCLRSKKAKLNVHSKGCQLDHDHCHNCGEERHRAFECPDVVPSDFNNNNSDNKSSVVFRMISSKDGNRILSIPYRGSSENYYQSSSPGVLQDLPSALIVLGGRLRGRTLATCEMLFLTSPSSYSTTSVSSQTNNEDGHQQRCWCPLPNLFEHRGSHAACSPSGSKLIFVMGGGTADGNSDIVELLDFTQRLGSSSSSTTSLVKDTNEWRWRKLESRLSSPRHAFGAVSCSAAATSELPSVSIFVVGGWKYGSVSCESMERLNFDPHHGTGEEWAQQQPQQQWETCSSLLLPRRLHSVVASADNSSIYVLGGFINERTTTRSIERYDICTNKWTAVEELPFHEHNCPLIQAVADEDGTFLIFPFSSEQKEIIDNAPLVLRYTPGSNTPFLPISVPISVFDYTHHQQQQNNNYLKLPIANWHSFSVTKSKSLKKAYLVGGTINGKWTNKSYELDLISFDWTELPPMTFPRRRLAAVVLE